MQQFEPHIVQYLQGLASELAQAKHGQKTALIKQACGMIGRSEQWVYDSLKEMNLTEGRKARCDRGVSKVSRKECSDISNLMMQSNRDNGKQLMSLKEAVRIGKANGLLGNDISVSTIAREMKRLNVHPDQLKKGAPHTQVRSLHPNHVWQFDVSVCVLYYLKCSVGLQVMP
ncbi:MAG: integrase, partial [Pseudomonadales bacterium]